MPYPSLRLLASGTTALAFMACGDGEQIAVGSQAVAMPSSTPTGFAPAAPSDEREPDDLESDVPETKDAGLNTAETKDAESDDDEHDDDEHDDDEHDDDEHDDDARDDDLMP